MLQLHLLVLDRDNVPLLQMPLVAAGEDDPVMIDLVLQSAVEVLITKLASSRQLYLKQIDKVTPEWAVSAFVTLGNIKFILLHPIKIDEATLKIFFSDVHTAFVKSYMSPFSDDGKNIDCNGVFSKAIVECSRKLYRYNQ